MASSTDTVKGVWGSVSGPINALMMVPARAEDHRGIFRTGNIRSDYEGAEGIVERWSGGFWVGHC